MPAHPVSHQGSQLSIAEIAGAVIPGRAAAHAALSQVPASCDVNSLDGDRRSRPRLLSAGAGWRPYLAQRSNLLVQLVEVHVQGVQVAAGCRVGAPAALETLGRGPSGATGKACAQAGLHCS